MVNPVPKLVGGVVAVVALLALSACSFSAGGASMDKAQVEKKISAALKQQVGTAPDKVVCPRDLKAEKGTKMRCVLTADGTKYGVTVTVTTVKGDTVNFDIKVDDAPLGESGGSGATDAQALKVGAAFIASSNAGSSEDERLVVDDETKACVGESAITQLGAGPATEASTVAFDKFSPVQKAAITAAFDECLKGSTIASLLVGSFYSQGGGGVAPSPAVTSCVAGALEGKVGTVAFALADAENGQLPPEVVASLDTCVPKADLAALLKEAVNSSGSVPDATAECIANKVAGQVTFGDLLAAGADQNSAAAAGLTQKFTEAAQGC